MEASEKSVERRKKKVWSLIFFGIFFLLYGVAALATGRSYVDIAEADGPNVRVAGALMSVVGIGLAVLGFQKK